MSDNDKKKDEDTWMTFFEVCGSTLLVSGLLAFFPCVYFFNCKKSHIVADVSAFFILIFFMTLLVIILAFIIYKLSGH
jgi:hypothetical protein